MFFQSRCLFLTVLIVLSMFSSKVASFSSVAVRRHLGSFSSLAADATTTTTTTSNSKSNNDTMNNNPNDMTQASPRVGTQKGFRLNSNTGGLRRLPVVRRHKEMIASANKEAFRIRPDATIGNIRMRARKHGAETINKLMDELCLPLRDTVQGYKAEWKRLHPFERVVADLTARSRQKKDGLTLNRVLDEVHEARKEIREAGKDWIAKVKSAETAREAADTLEEGKTALMDLFDQLAGGPVTSLLELQRGLRSSPTVALDTPAVVLVGAPNVGKSSIVRRISSGTPEVNSYPFTTRGMTLGHIEVFWSDNATVAQAVIPESSKKSKHVSNDVLLGKYAFSQLCQVMDSPGLLARPDEERNEMEALTMAAMQHLPTAVMFVLDLTGGAGDKCSSVEDQLELRREVRARFPRRPWVDVVSKIDLGVTDEVLSQLEEITGEGNYIELSVHEDIGVEELKVKVLKMLGEVRVVLDAMTAVDTRTVRPSSTGA